MSELEGGRRWTEEETVLALYLYFQLPFGKLHSGNPEIKKLAAAIGRTDDSVAMKLCNFASLDPKIVTSGRKGLRGASKLDRTVYDQFGSNWTELVEHAGKLWAARVGSGTDEAGPAVKETRADFRFEPYEGESAKQALISIRLGQRFFRRAVLANFEDRCCITGIAEPRLLIASHIKPWGADVENRQNPANGFLFSATFDKAFDRGLITITANYRVRVSRQLLDHSSEETREWFSPYEGVAIRRGIRFDPDPAFLKWHNANCFIDAT